MQDKCVLVSLLALSSMLQRLADFGQKLILTRNGCRDSPMCVKLANVSTQRNPNVKLLRQSSPWHVMTPHPTARLVTFTVFRRVAAPKRAPHPTEHSGESVAVAFTVFREVAAPKRAATSNMKRAFSRVYSLPEGGRPAHRIQHSTRERAFSRVYSLPESGRPEARAASNRALRRERLVAFGKSAVG